MFARPFLLVILLAASAGAQTDAWLEVRTPNFDVITNSTQKESLHVALQFERMRSVFHRLFPDANLDTAAPIVVLAVQDKQNVRALEPEIYLGNGQLNLAGLYLRLPEANYVLVWLNAPGLHPFSPVYHEYAHFVQSRSGEWMPLWLSEGWAQYYQTAEILDHEVHFGKLDPYTWGLLQHNPLLPLPTLLAVDTHSPYYHEEDKGSMFYAESWALTHYLKTKDARDGTHRLQDYLDLVHKQVDSAAAATQVFGDLDQLQIDLKKYIVDEDYPDVELPGATDVDDSSFIVRTMTQTQADTFRAEFLAHDERFNDARTLLETVLHDDPNNVSAHQSMGYIAFRQRNFDEARKWYEQAIKLDPQSFLAHYYFAGAVIKKGLPDAATQAAIENSLRTVIKLNPSFAPGYYGLGLLMGMQGKNYEEARRWTQKAIQMDPGNVMFRVDDANILLMMGRNQDAVEALHLALKMSYTPEETAAVESVLQTEQRYEAERAKLRQQGLVPLHAARLGGKGSATSSAPFLTDPRGIYTPQPEYTEEARQAHREGVCIVSFIVGLDGKPSNIVVTKKLGLGLDEKAVAAVRTWKFEPARRYGQPVAIRMNVSLNFKLFGNDKILALSDRVKSGGDAAAEFELANAFFAGREIPKDEAQGAALLERAARDGLPKAQFQMGERTYGDGSNPENYVSAYVWFALAQRGGVADSEPRVNDLALKMSPDQLSEAQKRLDRWAESSTH
jgi:TonB family protein